jgi:hypothetical protein
LGCVIKHQNQTTRGFNSTDWVEKRPDIDASVCALVADDKLTEPAYVSPAGSIAPIDILYRHRSAMVNDNLYMAHRCGFTKKVLSATLQASSFQSLAVMARPSAFDLWAIASKAAMLEADLPTSASYHFPA